MHVQEEDKQLLVQERVQFFNKETRRWNHHHTIGGDAAKSVSVPSKDEVQNRVSVELLLEILQALPE